MGGRRPAGLGLIAIASIAASAVSIAPSAQTAQQPPTFRSGVELIEVDATVLDRDGNPIPDLQAADFAVTVDGEPRAVVQAQFISLRAPAGNTLPADSPAEDAGYTSNADADPGRLIVILVDEESIPFGEGRHVMHAAAEFVDGLSPGDRVSVVAMPQPGVYIDFTSDHDRVRRAVEGMSGLGTGFVGRGGGGGGGAGGGGGGAGGGGGGAGGGGGGAGGGGGGAGGGGGGAGGGGGGAGGGDGGGFGGGGGGVEDSSGPVPDPVASGIDLAMLLETRRRSETVRHGIESILEGMRGLEGPKALVWISGGFVIDGAVMGLQRMAELAAASRTTLYVFMVDEPLVDASRSVGGDLPEAFVLERPPAMENMGLWLGPPNTRRKRQGLLAAASMTGGSLVRPQYNPGPLFARLERELSGYYLLGVESRAADRDGEFHDIEVSVQREGAHVRAHREVHVPPEGAGPGAEERIMRLLRSPVAARELPLRVATYAYRGADGESGQMQILVCAEGDAPGSVPAALSMGYLLRDPEGAVASRATVQVTPRLVQKPDGPVFEASFVVRVERPGAYSLKLAAIDATGRRGSVEHAVPAPRTSDGPLAAGDLMLADQASAPLGRIFPQVEAQVSSGRLLAFTELYADSPAFWERTAVEVDVIESLSGPVLARGPAVLEGPEGAPRRSVTAVVAVPHLPPGRYVARARVMHDAAEVAQVRRLFRITAPPGP